MKNEIDLSKLSIRQSAVKTIKANFDGTEREYEIRDLTDSEQLDFEIVRQNDSDAMRFRKMHILLLTLSLGIAQNVAELLYETKWSECVRVCNEIIQFHKEVESAKAKEAETAEKNSTGETSVPQK